MKYFSVIYEKDYIKFVELFKVPRGENISFEKVGYDKKEVKELSLEEFENRLKHLKNSDMY